MTAAGTDQMGRNLNQGGHTDLGTKVMRPDARQIVFSLILAKRAALRYLIPGFRV